MQGFWYSAYTHSVLTYVFCAVSHRNQDHTAEAWDKAGTRLYSKVPGKKRVVAYFVWLEEGFPVWATSKARSSARKIETLWSV